MTGNIWAKGDANLVAGNIKKGVTIFGVAGTYDGYLAQFGGGSLWYVMPISPNPESRTDSDSWDTTGTVYSWNQLTDEASRTVAGVAKGAISWPNNKCYTGMYWHWRYSSYSGNQSRNAIGQIWTRTVLPASAVESANKMTIKYTVNLPPTPDYNGTWRSSSDDGSEDYNVTGKPLAFLTLMKWNRVREQNEYTGGWYWDWQFTPVQNIMLNWSASSTARTITGQVEITDPLSVLKLSNISNPPTPSYPAQSNHLMADYSSTYGNATSSTYTGYPIAFRCGVDICHYVVWDYQPLDSDKWIDPDWNINNFKNKYLEHWDNQGAAGNGTTYRPISATIDSVVLTK